LAKSAKSTSCGALCARTQQSAANASVSQDNEQIAAAEGQIKQLQEQIRRYEAQGGSAATPAGGPPEPQMDTAAKMERLLQQEGELTHFIDNFDMNKGTALGELAAHKQVGPAYPPVRVTTGNGHGLQLRDAVLQTPAPAVAPDVPGR
jgi:hypothetical protein